MSRYHKRIDNRVLIYGFDHALGYWYELWDYDKDEEDGFIEEGDQACSAKTRNEIIEILEDYDVDQEHIHSIVFNLPF